MGAAEDTGAEAEGCADGTAGGAAADCPPVLGAPRPATAVAVTATQATTPPATAAATRRPRIRSAFPMMSSAVVCGGGAVSCTDFNTSRMWYDKVVPFRLVQSDVVGRQHGTQRG